MTISLASGAAPIFFGRPCVNNDAYKAGGILASSSQSLVHRVYQMDPSAQWPSAAADDTVVDTITVTFFLGSGTANNSIDSFFLFNTNLKNFLVEYNDTVLGWTTVAGMDYSIGTADFALSDLVIILGAAVIASGVRITMYRTQTANAYKLVGSFQCALSTFQPSRPPMKILSRYMQQRRDVQLADGTIDYSYLMWSDNSYTLTDFEIEYELMPAADKALFDSVFFAAMGTFLYYSEPGDDVRSLYVSTLQPGSYQPAYQSGWKGNGYKIPMYLQNLGYV